MIERRRRRGCGLFSSLPAAPLARRATVSLVDNVPVGGDGAEGFVHCRSEEGVECAMGYWCVCAKDAEEGVECAGASVQRMPRRVAMFWCIIPAPLLMPARKKVVQGRVNVRERDFGCADGLGGGELVICVMSPCCGGRRGF